MTGLSISLNLSLSNSLEQRTWSPDHSCFTCQSSTSPISISFFIWKKRFFLESRLLCGLWSLISFMLMICFGDDDSTNPYLQVCCVYVRRHSFCSLFGGVEVFVPFIWSFWYVLSNVNMLLLRSFWGVW